MKRVLYDSGLDASADFAKRITHFYDFTSGRAHRTAPSDPYGHGTHVAGLIGGRYVGVAPKVNLDVPRAIEFATDTARRSASTSRASRL